MQDVWMADVEGQLSELNLRLADETLDEAERDTLLEQEDRLLARRKTYQAAPTGGDRRAVVQGFKDAMNAAQQRIDDLDSAPPARAQDERLQRGVEREKIALDVAEFEQRLEYAGHDDEGLAAVLEDAEIRAEELRDQAMRFHPNDVRTRKTLRERQAAQLKVGEIQREVNRRLGLGAAAKLREKTNNSIADHEAKIEWKKIGERRIAEAILKIQDGEPAWLLERAKEEAKAIPPPEFLERKRREVAGRS